MARLLFLILTVIYLVFGRSFVVVKEPDRIMQSYGIGTASSEVRINPDTQNVPKTRTPPSDEINGVSLMPVYENGMEYVFSQISQSDRENVAVMLKAMSENTEYCELVHPVDEDIIWEYVHFVHDNLCGWAHVDLYNFYYYTDDAGSVYAVEFRYLFDRETAERLNRESAEAIDRIVSEAPTDSERARIRYLHDRLCEICEYGYDGLNCGSPYGALVEGTAICQGYSNAFQMLLSRAGFDSFAAIGLVEDEYHKWNYVRLSDGKWYAIDPTWDDPDWSEEPIYDYFLITDAKLSEDHGKRYGSRFYDMPAA